MNKKLNILQIFYAWMLRKISKDYSWCHRCKKPWSYVKNHTTQISDGYGCFPLCQTCWKKLTPKERLPYYRDLYEEWREDDEELWKKIEVAVMLGK